MPTNIPYPIIDMKKTGENIKHLRESRCISVVYLQYFLGLASPQAVYLWQRGINLPTVDHLCAMSHAFNVPMNDILVPQEADICDNTTSPASKKRSMSMAKPAIATAAL